jgi:hypothetical protein
MTGTLAPVVTEALTRSSLSAPKETYSSIISEAVMAWILVDTVDAYLTGHERTMIFVELGSGEQHLAIRRILEAVASNPTTLPATIYDLLSHWLNGYVGNPEGPRLRALLAHARARQFEPVRWQRQQAPCTDGRHAAARIGANVTR